MLYSTRYVLVIALAGAFIVPASASAQDVSLSNEDLVNLTRPAVVRIGTSVQGTVVVPGFDFDINLEEGEFSNFRVLPEEQPVSVSLDESRVGSGFIVGRDGYILTNSHVAFSPQVASQQTVADLVIRKIIFEKTLDLSLDELSQYRVQILDITKGVSDVLSREASNTLASRVAVSDPSFDYQNAEELLAEGFEAEVIFANKNFWYDQKDVALLRIAKNNLPTLPMGSSGNLEQGASVAVFGFPATADFSEQSIAEPSFTTGVINAIKTVDLGDFNVIQTDARISSGSSGSPLLNTQGEAVGIITFQTFQLVGSGGDNFGFAIPIELGQEVTENNPGSAEKHPYHNTFLSALSLFKQRNCEDAILEFEKAKDVNASFSVDQYVDPYIQECQNVIAEGGSIDGWWDRQKESLRALSAETWFMLVGGFAGFALLSTALVLVTRRLRAEEKELHELEEVVERGHRDKK